MVGTPEVDDSLLKEWRFVEWLGRQNQARR